jgi:TPR repeat protein
MVLALVVTLSGCGEGSNWAAQGYEKYLAGDTAAAQAIWLEGAARNDDMSLYYLGRINEVGAGVSQDFDAATRYYHRSAQLGNPYAQGSLAVLYAYGRGVPRDFIRSYAYSTLAANGYSRWADGQRAAALRNRDLVATRMSGAEVVAAQRLADQLAGNPAEAIVN